MRILADRRTRQLFLWTLLIMVVFHALAFMAVGLHWKYAAYCVPFFAIGQAASVLCALYLYFRGQDRIMEKAVAQIQG